MGNDFITFLLVVIFILSLGWIIFLKNRKNKIAQAFLFFSITMAIWVFSNYMEDAVSIGYMKNFLLRMDFVSAAFMSFSFLLFSYNFSKDFFKFKIKIYGIVFLVLTLIFVAQIFFGKLVISGTELFSGVINPIYGPIYYFYIAFNLLNIFLGLLLLVVKYKKESRDTRHQTLFIFIGFFLMIVTVFITNVLLPNFIETQSDFLFISRLGIYSGLILAGFMSYSVAKTSFLNMKVISAQLFSVAMVLVFFLQLFSLQTKSDLFFKVVFLFIVIYFSKMIVSSVKSEVQRKEELQLMSDKLAQANDQLRKLDNAKSEFISIASHQLRTPLTAIKGFISLMLEGSYGKMAPEQVDVLNKVYSSNERLVNLVEDLLNISRIESGRMEFQFDKWQIENICQEVIDTFVLKAKEHKLYLEYKKPDQPLPELIIDGVKVREVISNLVDNAIKYTLEGKGGVTLKVEQRGESIRVTVSDTGIGIPESELPYLFAKFSRGKDTSRLNTGGTGLGLYVGKTMIENNGGKIWAESDGQGLGSRFIIELPIVKHKEEAEERLQKFINKI